MRSWTLVVMLGVLWPASPVMAEHTADHRYTIVGYVKQADGTPRPNTLVSVRERQGARLGVASTEASGWYSLRLHLHDSDLGRLLTVEANNVARQIRVTFDPNDGTTERLQRVDFVGPQALEIPLAQRSLIPYILLALGAAVGLIPASLYVTSHRKKQKARAAGQHHRESRALAGHRPGRKK